MIKKKSTEVSAQIQKNETEGGHFTGTVAIEELIKSEALPDVSGTKLLRVYFAPKAHTHWHSHPVGQVLHVVAGKGLFQERNGQGPGPLTSISAGDTVYSEHEVQHWHGAAPDSFMVHLAVSPYTVERDTEWGEEVVYPDTIAEDVQD